MLDNLTNKQKLSLIKDAIEVMNDGKKTYGLDSHIIDYYEVDWEKVKEKWENLKDKEKPFSVRNFMVKKEFTLRDILTMTLETYKELDKPKITINRPFDAIPCDLEGGSTSGGRIISNDKVISINGNASSIAFDEDIDTRR